MFDVAWSCQPHRMGHRHTLISIWIWMDDGWYVYFLLTGRITRRMLSAPPPPPAPDARRQSMSEPLSSNASANLNMCTLPRKKSEPRDVQLERVGGHDMWWHHDLETLPALLGFCEGNPPVTSGFHSQRTSNAEIWWLFCVSLSKLLNKQFSC